MGHWFLVSMVQFSFCFAASLGILSSEAGAIGGDGTGLLKVSEYEFDSSFISF